MLGFVCWYVRLERLTLVIAFVSKGFPYKDQTEESFIDLS